MMMRLVWYVAAVQMVAGAATYTTSNEDFANPERGRGNPGPVRRDLATVRECGMKAIGLGFTMRKPNHGTEHDSVQSKPPFEV